MQACTILPRSRPSTTTWPPGRRSTVTRAEKAGSPTKPKRLARAARSPSLATISRAAPLGPMRSRSTTRSISDFCSLLETWAIFRRCQVVARRVGEPGGLAPNVGFEPGHHCIVDRRPTAIGIAAQDLGQRRRAAGQRGAVGQRPALQALCHDLDAAPDAKILHADLAQGEVEMVEHGVEKLLRQ